MKPCVYPRLTMYFSAAAAVMMQSGAAAAEEVEFDSSLLHRTAGSVAADISRFGRPGAVLPGKYRVDLYLNGRYVKQLSVRFDDAAGADGLCAGDWLRELELRRLPEWPSEGCVAAKTLLPEADWKFDIGRLRLDVAVPQALQITRPADEVAASLRLPGSPAAFAAYHFNEYRSSYAGKRSASRYLGVRAGISGSMWALRHSGHYTSGAGKGRYLSSETYLTRDIDAWNSRIVLGDFYSRNESGDTLPLRGLMLYSEQQMLPESQQAFAPLIQGTVRSNARVSVRQGGRLIYETTVSGGAFSIDNLNAYGSGDIEVEITEDNGEVRRFALPFSQHYGLLRPGRFAYRAAAGYLRGSDRGADVPVVQGGVQYGVSNHLTVKSGLTAARRYTDASISALVNTKWGLGELSLSQQQVKLPQHTRSSSIEASWSKHIGRSDTYLNIKTAYYGGSGRYRMQQVQGGQPSADGIRSRYSISLNQKLGRKYGTLYLSGISTQHRQGRRQHEYQLVYGNAWQRLQYRLNVSRSRLNDTAERRNSIGLSLSLPLETGSGERYRNMMSSVGIGRSPADDIYRNVSLSAVSRNLNYSASLAVAGNRRHYSANAAYRLPFASLGAGFGGDNRGGRQLSYRIDGAFVAHSYGITAVPDLDETFAVVHVPGGAGVRVGSSRQRLDYLGNGVVGGLNAYRYNRIALDGRPLKDSIEIDEPVRRIVPRRYLVPVLRFGAVSGRPVMLALQPEGVMPPLGAEVYENDRRVGYVVQGGRVWVRGIAQKGGLEAVWGTDAAQRCSIAYRLQNRNTASKTMVRHPAVCRAAEASQL
ncbi:MAG: fimbria/pilus outer membrane usher protein [Neisseria sp.]|nr:fimbria/pilus outer membrane usher protein [Neisseria sp.]